MMTSRLRQLRIVVSEYQVLKAHVELPLPGVQQNVLLPQEFVTAVRAAVRRTSGREGVALLVCDGQHLLRRRRQL